MTRSAELVAKARKYVELERKLYRGESPLQAAALELASEYEILFSSALRLEGDKNEMS